MPLTKLIVHQEIDTLAVTELFHAQRNIRHLELKSDLDKLPRTPWDLQHLTKDDLPNLERLSAPLDSVKLLVPGRPVNSVRIKLGYFDKIDPDLWVKLSESSTSLQMLELSPFARGQTLERPALHPPMIRHLRLIVKVVRDIPELETLCLSCGEGEALEPNPPYLAPDYDVRLWDRNVWFLFTISKTLKEVNILGRRSFTPTNARDAAIEQLRVYGRIGL
ncbi:hypothetical protein FS837_003209 [Tulasnella sp. UAMH 9824]|nr:hypothetical protein FS837_003209 [Tulasnella sp. UAMH 9824]